MLKNKNNYVEKEAGEWMSKGNSTWSYSDFDNTPSV